MPSGRNRIRVGPRAVVLLVVVGLAGLELGLRHLVGYARRTVTESSARFGWRLMPDQEREGRKPGVPERINSRGYRDREWGETSVNERGRPARDKGFFRVALLGNSVTYGTDLPIERTWGRVLERQLQAELERRRDRRRAQVMNFALPGYVFAQMARVFEDDVVPYRPDVVVVALFPYDVRRMLVSADHPDYPLRRWIVRSALHEFLVQEVLGRRGELYAASADERSAAKEGVDRANRKILRDPFAPEHAQAWDELFRGLERVRGLAEELSIAVAVVAMPSLEAVADPGRPSGADRLGPWAAERPSVVFIDPQEAFRTATERLLAEIESTGRSHENVWVREVLLGAPDFGRRERLGLRRAGDSPFFFYDPGHYSARGHELLAREVFRALRDRLLPAR